MNIFLRKLMRLKRLFISIFIVVLVLTAGFFLTKPAFNHLAGYLSKSEQVKANILIVEGWLPQYAIDLAFKEFEKNKYDYIVTTGLKYFEEYFELSENGYLVFHPKIANSVRNEESQHTIEVNASGSLNGAYSAHFNLYVNNVQKGDFFADKHKRKYSVKWVGSLSGIETIAIQFTNDKVDEYGDINLYVKDIVIDHKIVIPFLNNSEYDMSQLGGKRRMVNNFNSVAELARNQLLAMGVDSAKVTAVPGAMVNINRTLTSALAFRDWLAKSDINIKGLNIISLGAHTRRTWMIYNKILKDRYPIGIISVPDYNYNRSYIYKLFKTIRETLGIIYYRIILIPY
jgi:Ca-dependent carbohydrate-binding module xylan-binding